MQKEKTNIRELERCDKEEARSRKKKKKHVTTAAECYYRCEGTLAATGGHPVPVQ
jgi:hypothetical protein